MRTHGWGGAPPSTDEEAIARILAATRRCIDAQGTETSLADVARALQVTRQTVYRYFPSTEDLLTATAADAAGGFLVRLAGHCGDRAEPGDAVVEALAFALEELPAEPYLNLLLTSGRVGAFALGVTSETALAFGRAFLLRLPVDWEGAGFDDGSLADLVERMLRTFQSLALDPGRPPRRGAALREFLDGWLAPGIRGVASSGVGSPP